MKEPLPFSMLQAHNSLIRFINSRESLTESWRVLLLDNKEILESDPKEVDKTNEANPSR